MHATLTRLSDAGPRGLIGDALSLSAVCVIVLGVLFVPGFA